VSTTRQIETAALPAFGVELARTLDAQPFCLWLQGPLGAGKTTLTGHILRGLGLPADAKVTSPTYTYMNEYRIDGRWYAHLDLYRAKPDFSTEELGLLDARPFHGVFVEWPEKAPGDPGLVPSHVLTLAFTDADDRRSVSLASVQR
jgi:tRNA threonylcarbamoyl adenosine modification protein YjeE